MSLVGTDRSCHPLLGAFPVILSWIETYTSRFEVVHPTMSDGIARIFCVLPPSQEARAGVDRLSKPAASIASARHVAYCRSSCFRQLAGETSFPKLHRPVNRSCYQAIARYGTNHANLRSFRPAAPRPSRPSRTAAGTGTRVSGTATKSPTKSLSYL
jgi:hypothetical protein